MFLILQSNCSGHCLMSTKTPERLSVTIVVIIIMISRPANNKYWGAEAGVCILYQSPRPSLWPLYLWEESETSVSEIYVDLVIAHQDVPSGPWLGKKARVCWLDSEFSCPHSPLLTLHSATCFLSLLGDFGDWIKIYIFSQNFWEMIPTKSLFLFSRNKRNVIWWVTWINQLV